MPTRERVEEFIATVVSERHVEAIERFYHEDASMQENRREPRRGRARLIQHETEGQANFKSMRTHAPQTVIVEGDRVAICWVFDIVTHADETRRLEEVSLQTWRGDRILAEQFVYDTAAAWRAIDTSESVGQ